MAELLCQTQRQFAGADDQRLVLAFTRPLVVLGKRMQRSVEKRLTEEAIHRPAQNHLPRKQLIGLADKGDARQRRHGHRPTHEQPTETGQVVVTLAINTAKRIRRHRRQYRQGCTHPVVERDRPGVLLGEYEQQRHDKALCQRPLAPKGQSLEACASIDT
ncbi:hypothetical protein D3C81_1735760 [compost metagenome]